MNNIDWFDVDRERRPLRFNTYTNNGCNTGKDHDPAWITECQDCHRSGSTTRRGTSHEVQSPRNIRSGDTNAWWRPRITEAHCPVSARWWAEKHRRSAPIIWFPPVRSISPKRRRWMAKGFYEEKRSHSETILFAPDNGEGGPSEPHAPGRNIVAPILDRPGSKNRGRPTQLHPITTIQLEVHYIQGIHRCHEHSRRGYFQGRTANSFVVNICASTTLCVCVRVRSIS